MATPSVCSQKMPLKEKYVDFNTYSNKSTPVSGNRGFNNTKVDSAGILVKRETIVKTSKIFR